MTAPGPGRAACETPTVADGDEDMVEIAFVECLARRIARGELSTEAARIAVDLAAGRDIGR